MIRTKIFFSILIFSFLLAVTSYIKTQTRIIEKKIEKKNKILAMKRKDLHETQLDFFYLSSPENIYNKIVKFDFKEYFPMDISRIYLSYDDFINSKKNITNLRNNDEEEVKKK